MAKPTPAPVPQAKIESAPIANQPIEIAPQVIAQAQIQIQQTNAMAPKQRLTPQFPVSAPPTSVRMPASAMTHPKSVDASATAVVEVQPPRATRLHLQVIGEARVGEMIDIYVHAIAESGALDQSFNDLVHLGCDRPVGGLAPLQFKDGIARLRVLCLTPGTHQFYLSLDPITALNRLQESRGQRIDLI